MGGLSVVSVDEVRGTELICFSGRLLTLAVVDSSSFFFHHAPIDCLVLGICPNSVLTTSLLLELLTDEGLSSETQNFELETTEGADVLETNGLAGFDTGGDLFAAGLLEEGTAGLLEEGTAGLLLEEGGGLFEGEEPMGGLVEGEEEPLEDLVEGEEGSLLEEDDTGGLFEEEIDGLVKGEVEPAVLFEEEAEELIGGLVCLLKGEEDPTGGLATGEEGGGGGLFKGGGGGLEGAAAFNKGEEVVVFNLPLEGGPGLSGTTAEGCFNGGPEVDSLAFAASDCFFF